MKPKTSREQGAQPVKHQQEVSMRGFCHFHRVSTDPSKPPQPSLPPKVKQRTACTPCISLCFEVDAKPSGEDEYKSVYQKDFRVWKINKRKPFKLSDSLKVNRGLSVPSATPQGCSSQKVSVCVAANSKPDPGREKPPPMECMTSYRHDFIRHAVQPNIQRRKPANQTNKDMLDDKGYQCRRRTPELSTVENFEKSKEPLQTMTTMRKDFKALNVARKVEIFSKKKRNEQQIPSNFQWAYEPERIRTTKQKPLSPQSKPCETGVCNSNCPVNKETHYRANVECNSKGTEESMTFCYTSLTRGITLADADICEKPPEAHKVTSCMGSRKTRSFP